MTPLYTVKITKNDSVTPVMYEGIKYVWWQENGTVLAMMKGAKGVDREYIMYPLTPKDHVHVIEEVE